MRTRLFALVTAAVLTTGGSQPGPSTVAAGDSRTPVNDDSAVPAQRRSGERLRSSAQRTAAESQVVKSLDTMPLYFIENRGQMDPLVSYYVQGRDKGVFFTSRGLLFVLTMPPKASEQRQVGTGLALRTAAGEGSPPWRPTSHAVELEFVGARETLNPAGEDITPAIISYFKGPREQWNTALRTFSRVVYRDVWPGIDLVYTGTMNRMKYTFELKPGADPGRIRLAYHGATGVRLTEARELEVTTPAGSFHDARPHAFQESDGRRVEVSAAYALDSRTHEYGFRVGPYDPARPLVLDPAVLVYGSFEGVGGSDSGLGIAVDWEGNAYVAEETVSCFLFDCVYDAFVFKVNAAGTGVLYGALIGGDLPDGAFDIAVDGAGSAYVAGFALSTEGTFPVRIGPDLSHNGFIDAFVAKINPEGTDLVYAGYIGGAGLEAIEGIAVDAAGHAYVTGFTSSHEGSFPVAVGPDLTHNGGTFRFGNESHPLDTFVAKIRPDGSGLVYCGYIGGAGDDTLTLGEAGDESISGGQIAVDTDGNAYVGSTTTSDETTFPNGQGFASLGVAGFDQTYNGRRDAYVVKVNAAGTGLVYATYVGGAGDDAAVDIAIDWFRNAYITGFTTSSEATFPATVGPDLTHNGGVDTLVAKLNAAGTGLVFAGYIGGAEIDQGLGIAASPSGTVYVAGVTDSTESTFPVIEGPDLTHNGGIRDAFVAKLKPNPNDPEVKNNFVYLGYIGGAGFDEAFSIADDMLGHAYVSGTTSSDETTFPDGHGFNRSVPGFDQTFNGGTDAFVVKVGDQPAPLASATTRSFDEWLDAQGTFCFPDGMGGCLLYTDPALPFNFLAFRQTEPERCAVVDYAGLVNRWLIENFSIDLGTKVTGTVVERADSRWNGEIHVRLRATNALAYVSDGCNLRGTSPLLFGHRPSEVAAGAEAALATVEFEVIYLDFRGFGLPLTDLVAYFSGFFPGSLVSLAYHATATGPLRSAFGVADGTPGKARVTLVDVVKPGTAGVHPVPVVRIELQALRR